MGNVSKKRNADVFVVNTRSVERAILVALAGDAAEQRFAREFDCPPLQHDGDDLRRAKSLIAQLPHRLRAAALARLRFEIERLFNSPLVWQATTQLADTLLRRRKLTSDLASAIINMGLKRQLSRPQRRSLAKDFAEDQEHGRRDS
jgi:hypothetical protein